jgi:hypothetical protein
MTRNTVVEATLGQVVVHDVTDIVPKHRWKRWEIRPPEDIKYAFVHHSGALGSSGLQGLLNSARFAVTYRKWVTCPYTYWIPAKPQRDSEGRYIIYRVNRDDQVTYHTGGQANHTGVSVGIQGNWWTKRPGWVTKGCLLALLGYLQGRHAFNGGDWLWGHSESKPFGGSGKRTCPGPHILGWLRTWRRLLR